MSNARATSERSRRVGAPTQSRNVSRSTFVLDDDKDNAHPGEKEKEKVPGRSKLFSKVDDVESAICRGGLCTCCDDTLSELTSSHLLRGVGQIVFIAVLSLILIGLIGFQPCGSILIPLWMAAVLTLVGATCWSDMKPNFKWLMFWLPSFGLAELVFYHNYGVACRREWKVQLSNEILMGEITIQKESKVFGEVKDSDKFNCAIGVEDWAEWPKDQQDWCCESYNIACPPPSSLMHHQRQLRAHPMDLVVDDVRSTNVSAAMLRSYCSLETNPSFGNVIPHLNRCSKSATLFDKVCRTVLDAECPPWTCMYAAQIHITKAYKYALSLMGSLLITMLVALNPCGSELLRKYLGFGEPSNWLIWYWVFYLVNLVVEVTIFVQGITMWEACIAIGKIMNGITQDLFMVLIMSILCAGVLFAICNQEKIKRCLGIDDVSVFHWDFRSILGFDFTPTGSQFQMCIYQVAGSEHALGLKQEGHSRGMFSLFGTSERRAMQGLAGPYTMYVRIGFGENVPQTTRAIAGTGFKPHSKVTFRQSFLLNLNFGLSPPTMYITLFNRGNFGSDRHGRVTLDTESLQEYLDAADKLEDHFKEEGQESLAVQQVMAMMKQNVSVQDLVEELGFHVLPLSKGGCVVVAFAHI